MLGIGVAVGYLTRGQKRIVLMAEIRFAELLRTYRMRAGLSQNKLARLAGIDPAHVNHLEKERKNSNGKLFGVSRPTVIALAESMDLTTGEADRLLFAAGLAPQIDWQAQATKAEQVIASLRVCLEDYDG